MEVGNISRLKNPIYKELNLPESKYPLVATVNSKQEMVYVEDQAEPYIIQYSKAGIFKREPLFYSGDMKQECFDGQP